VLTIGFGMLEWKYLLSQLTEDFVML